MSKKLIVLAAFKRGDEGEFISAFDPRQIDTEERDPGQRPIGCQHSAAHGPSQL